MSYPGWYYNFIDYFEHFNFSSWHLFFTYHILSNISIGHLAPDYSVSPTFIHYHQKLWTFFLSFRVSQCPLTHTFYSFTHTSLQCNFDHIVNRHLHPCNCVSPSTYGHALLLLELYIMTISHRSHPNKLCCPCGKLILAKTLISSFHIENEGKKRNCVKLGTKKPICVIWIYLPFEQTHDDTWNKFALSDSKWQAAGQQMDQWTRPNKRKSNNNGSVTWRMQSASGGPNAPSSAPVHRPGMAYRLHERIKPLLLNGRSESTYRDLWHCFSSAS